MKTPRRLLRSFAVLLALAPLAPAATLAVAKTSGGDR